MTKCVLCGSGSTQVLETVQKDDIAALYRKFLHLEVQDLFPVPEIQFLQCSRCGLRFFSPLIPGDEPFYSALQCFAWYYPDERSEFQAAARWIHEKDRVLEIGCGRGAFARYLPGKTYEGIDLSENAVCLARQAGLDVTRAAMADFAAARAQAYDVVCAFQTLEHVTDPGEFLRAAISCLALGGRLILSVPSDSAFAGRSCNAVLNLPPHHLTRWPDQTLEWLGRHFGARLAALQHLPLEPEHREWFAMTRILSLLGWWRVLRGKTVVDNSGSFWACYRAARYLARRGAAVPDMSPPPPGHTVLAIYQLGNS